MSKNKKWIEIAENYALDCAATAIKASYDTGFFKAGTRPDYDTLLSLAAEMDDLAKESFVGYIKEKYHTLPKNSTVEHFSGAFAQSVVTYPF